MNSILAIPEPKVALVPPGWAKDVVLPWAEKLSDVKQLQGVAAGLAGAIEAYRKMGYDGLELAKAQRIIETRIGELLGKPEQTYPGKNTSQASEALSKDDRHRFRELADIKDKVLEYLDNANTAKKCSRSALLRLAKAEATEKATAETVHAKYQDICDIRLCDFSELLSDCKADVIITDPPYPKEFVPLYGRFAKAAKDSGIPVVAVMCGQTYFPTVLSDMCKYLDYRWLLCYLTPGGSLQQFSEKALCGWKPVVLFGGDKWVYDVFKSDKEDKRFHDWGQSVGGLSDLVERLSEPGQTICDPFCGGGSTAIASLLLGRKFVGCDIDKTAVESSILRARRICNGKS